MPQCDNIKENNSTITMEKWELPKHLHPNMAY